MHASVGGAVLQDLRARTQETQGVALVAQVAQNLQNCAEPIGLDGRLQQRVHRTLSQMMQGIRERGRDRPAIDKR